MVNKLCMFVCVSKYKPSFAQYFTKRGRNKPMRNIACSLCMKVFYCASVWMLSTNGSIVRSMKCQRKWKNITSFLEPKVMFCGDVFCVTKPAKRKHVHMTKKSTRLSHLRSWNQRICSIFLQFLLEKLQKQLIDYQKLINRFFSLPCK